MNNNLYMSSLLKAFDVLDCFQDDKQELGISDIAVLVGMPAPTGGAGTKVGLSDPVV